jgi:hypothetical protein
MRPHCARHPPPSNRTTLRHLLPPPPRPRVRELRTHRADPPRGPRRHPGSVPQVREGPAGRLRELRKAAAVHWDPRGNAPLFLVRPSAAGHLCTMRPGTTMPRPLAHRASLRLLLRPHPCSPPAVLRLWPHPPPDRLRARRPGDVRHLCRHGQGLPLHPVRLRQGDRPRPALCPVHAARPPGERVHRTRRANSPRTRSPHRRVTACAKSSVDPGLAGQTFWRRRLPSPAPHRGTATHPPDAR